MVPRAQQLPQHADVLQLEADELFFDENNPRLSEAAEEGSPTGDQQHDILLVLWREFAVDELALSIAANGFFPHEPLFVAQEHSRYVVIEGNRRLAAVKLLRDARLRQLVGATDLPRITKQQSVRLDRLPALVLKREDVWQYLGFKHVNGPQAWQSYSKAQYIAWVHNDLGVPLNDIARQIGDKHATVARLYTALMALRQASDAGVYDVEDRWKQHLSFSHLYTGLGYAGIQSFIGYKPTARDTPTPIPKNKIREFGQLCEWLFGRRSKSVEPLVQTQNPDLRILDEVLQVPDGIAALSQGLPLDLALDISKGDVRLFRESLVAAKQALQEARGKLLSGYSGEGDLLEVMGDIVELAERTYDEMQEMRTPRRRSRSTQRGR